MDESTKAITDDSQDAEVHPFEAAMLDRVNQDFASAERFMQQFHAECKERYEMYFSARRYKDLRKDNQFPDPFFQDQIDKFVSWFMEKLFYKGRPCTLTGVEEEDKPDAEAKQAMMDWQDYCDNIENKVEILARDCAMYRLCVGQIDYLDKYKKRVVAVEKPALDPMGQPLTDAMGQPIMVSSVEPQESLIYRGATLKRIDPVDFFVTQEKSEIDDEHPVMIRSRQSMQYFKSKKYFRNYDRLIEFAPNREHYGQETPDNLYSKRMFRGYAPEKGSKRQQLEYIEWYGLVDKKALYEYEGKPIEIDGVPAFDDGEQAWCICGVVNGKVVTRLEESPFDFDGPNVVVGVIQSDEAELIGTSIADKIAAVAKGLDIFQGMFLENLKQSVNAMHVVKKSALVTPSSVVVNKAGGVIETNEDVDKVHKRVEQAQVSPDIYNAMTMYREMGQSASAVRNLIGGVDEPGAETLGENEILESNANMQMLRYLKNFERTFIRPLYEMRNQINLQFLDQNYVYGVIGQKAIEWRVIEPTAIRTNVDFICESATRETNRTIITQQIIQLADLIPIAQAAGFPTRVDKLLGQLAEQGFSWNTDKVESIWPSLRLEKMGMDLDSMLMQNMMLQMQAQQLMATMGPAQAIAGGRQGAEKPNPTSDEDAKQSAKQKSRPNIPRGR